MNIVKATAVAAAGAAIGVAIGCLQLGGVGAKPMSQAPDPALGPWFVDRMLASPKVTEAVTELVGVDPDDLSMGTPWRLHDMSQAMLTGEVTQNLAVEVYPSDSNVYIVPIMYRGETIVALWAHADVHALSGWAVTSYEGGDAAHALDELQPTDRILEWPLRHWFAIRGEWAIPINSQAAHMVTQTVTLAELQRLVMADIEMNKCPEGKICGSGGPVSGGADRSEAALGGPGLSWWPWLGAGVWLAGCLWLVRRRRAGMP